MKINTLIRLIAIPFANASPRSGPMPKCIKINARKPITVVSPLDKMEDSDYYAE